MQPKVTVIIPCYNAEKYIAKAISSIIAQTYENLEIIVVDDASTDGSLNIIKQFTDTGIRIIALKTNTKKIGAVNLAIEQAKGDYIAFQDADDWSESDRIEKQINQLQAYQTASAIFCGYNYFDIKGKLLSANTKIRTTSEAIEEEFFNFNKSADAMKFVPTMCATLIVKAEILKKVGGYHAYFAGRVAEDVHMVYRLLKYCRAMAIQKPIYNILRSENSLTENQLLGKNAKAAYSWQLLAKIIEYDQKGTDILLPQQNDLLKQIELEACEEALVKSIHEKNKLHRAYEKSAAYRIGRTVLSPYYLIKKLFSKRT